MLHNIAAKYKKVNMKRPQSTIFQAIVHVLKGKLETILNTNRGF